MSNYESQMRAWAIDRAIRMIEVGNVPAESDVAKLADGLVKYAYVREEDFADACKRMVECLKGMPDALEKVAIVQTELAYIEEQMQAQLSRSAANGTAKEAH